MPRSPAYDESAPHVRPRRDEPAALDPGALPLGLFYGDFFSRPNKAGGAWEDTFVDQSGLLDTRPVVFNVCNFTNKTLESVPHDRVTRDLLRHRRKYYIGQLDPCASIEFSRSKDDSYIRQFYGLFADGHLQIGPGVEVMAVILPHPRTGPGRRSGAPGGCPRRGPCGRATTIRGDWGCAGSP